MQHLIQLWCKCFCRYSNHIFLHTLNQVILDKLGLWPNEMKMITFHPIYSDFTANKKCARWSQHSLYGDLEHLQSTQLLLRYFSLDQRAFCFPSLNLTCWKVIILAKMSLILTLCKWDKHYITLAVIVHTVAVYFNDLILKIHGEMKWNSVNNRVYCTAVTINHLWLNCWPKLSLSDDQLWYFAMYMSRFKNSCLSWLRNDSSSSRRGDPQAPQMCRSAQVFSGPVQVT